MRIELIVANENSGNIFLLLLTSEILL